MSIKIHISGGYLFGKRFDHYFEVSEEDTKQIQDLRDIKENHPDREPDLIKGAILNEKKK